MSRATFEVELDLDDDGTYEEDITSDVISATTFQGRGDGMDAADIGQATLVLNNKTGRYSPKSGILAGFENYKKIRFRTITFSTQNHFVGFITDISVNSSPKKQTVTIKAADSLETFRRVIVSQRLMQHQPTGLILNRLIDASEGELCQNPAFDEDLTGYTNRGGATSSRVTTGTLMEGLAVMETTGAGSIGDGWRYSIPHTSDSEFQGKKISAAVYIWTENDSDVGRLLKIYIRDNVGSRGEIASIVLSKIPQRLSATASAFDAAATDFYVDIEDEFNSPVGAETWRTGAVHIVFLKDAISRDIDNGRTSISYYGPYREEALAALDEIRNSELGGFFYIDRSGVAKFEERTNRLSGTIVDGTVDEHFWKVDYSEAGEDLFSKVIFSHAKYDIGAPATYIWSLELPNSRPISVGGTAFIKAPYRALAKDNTKPVGNTDFRVNTQADGGGRDMLGTVGEGSVVPLTWVPYGEGADFKLVNNSTADVAWITQLAERATPIRPSSDEQTQEYEPDNPPPLRSELPHDFEVNDHPESVLNYAQFIGDYYETQREQVRITLRPRSAAILLQMLERKISDRVKIIDNNKSYSTQMNGEYYIESIRHRIRRSGFLHETTWTLSPVHDFYWILGTGELDDAQALATTTALAP